LTELSGTALGKIIERIEEKPSPATIALGFMLLTLDGDAVHKASSAIDRISRMARRDGKSHDLTFALDGTKSGITIHCNNEPLATAGRRLQNHCEDRKHIHRANSWFGIGLDSDGALRFGVNLEFLWQPNREMDKRVAASKQGTRIKKVGRNDPCGCGSGKKYKKCCLLG